jgi:hypothetical protein
LDANFTELYTFKNLFSTSGSKVGMSGTPVARFHLTGTDRTLSLAGLASGEGSSSIILMGNSDSGGASGPVVISSANGALTFGRGDSFSSSSGGTFTYWGGWTANRAFLIGATSEGSPDAGLSLLPAGQVLIGNHAQSAGWNFQQFQRSTVVIGSITQSGTTGVAYNTSSDYRLKDDVKPLQGSGTFIDALRPCTWSWKADGTRGVGFIAHELQAVSPSSVHGTKDAVEPIGRLVMKETSEELESNIPRPRQLRPGVIWEQTGERPVYQGVEYGSAEVIANLVAEVQDLRRRLAALEAEA